MRIFLSEFKRMVTSKEFYIGFLLTLGICMLNLLITAYKNMGLDVTQTTDAAHAFILDCSNGELFVFFITVYVILLVFPHSLSYKKEKSQQIDICIMTRAGRRTYYYSNVLLCFLGTFVMFFVPLVLENCMNMLIFQNERFHDFSYTYMGNISGDTCTVSAVSTELPFKRLYLANPMLYNVLYAAFFSLYSGLLAAFVYSISYWIKKYNVTLLLPVYLIALIQKGVSAFLNNVEPYLEVEMHNYYVVDGIRGLSWIYITALTAFFLLFIFVSTEMKCRKDQV